MSFFCKWLVLPVPKISSASIAKILTAVPLSQHVSQFVQLRRSGFNFVASCPFHGDSTPSFYVYEKDQRFHCFGCQKSGNLIDFEVSRSQLSFVDAVQGLAARYNIQLDYVDLDSDSERRFQNERQLKQELKALFAWAHKIYQDLLYSSDGHAARQYLFSQRHLDPDFCAKMEFGWAPGHRSALVKAQPGGPFTLEQLLRSGLVKRRTDGSCYDFFGARVMFPVRDEQGHVIAFGGRILVSEANPQQPKYLNSPESEIFSKSKILFHLFYSKKDIISKKYVLVVEGYIDCLSLFQAGIHNVVAVLGTSLTPEHVKVLSRLCGECVLWLDNDNAGDAARQRIFKWGFPQNLLSFSSVSSPTHFKDPDEVLQKNDREFVCRLLENRESLLDSIIKNLLKQSFPREILLRKVSQDIVKTIEAHPDSLLRSDAKARLASLLGISAWANQESLKHDTVPQEGAQNTSSETARPPLWSSQAPRWEAFCVEEVRFLVALCFAVSSAIPSRLRLLLNATERSLSDDSDANAVTALALTQNISALGLCLLEGIFEHLQAEVEQSFFFSWTQKRTLLFANREEISIVNDLSFSEFFLEMLFRVTSEETDVTMQAPLPHFAQGRGQQPQPVAVFSQEFQGYLRWWLHNLNVSLKNGSFAHLLDHELTGFELFFLNQQLSVLTRQLGVLDENTPAAKECEERRRWFFNQRVRKLMHAGGRS